MQKKTKKTKDLAAPPGPTQQRQLVGTGQLLTCRGKAVEVGGKKAGVRIGGHVLLESPRRQHDVVALRLARPLHREVQLSVAVSVSSEGLDVPVLLAVHNIWLRRPPVLGPVREGGTAVAVALKEALTS